MKIESAGFVAKNGVFNYNGSSIRSFAANPAFQGRNILEKQLTGLKGYIDAAGKSFQPQVGVIFSRLGKLGYDLQQRSDLVKEKGTELFYKRLNAADNNVFVQAKKNIDCYLRYIKNMKDFENYQRLAESEPYSSNSEIKKIIEDNKEKFTGASGEFEKFKPYHDMVIDTEKSMTEELDGVTLQKIPGFSERISTLKNKHIEALWLILNSGYTLITDFYKEYNLLVNANKKGTISFYKISDRISQLEERVKEFMAEKSLKPADTREIDKFLEQNANDKSIISTEEIKAGYSQLAAMVDNIVSKYTMRIGKCDIQADDKLISETLKYQNSVNSRLASLIQKEKEKIYSKSFEEQRSKFL